MLTELRTAITDDLAAEGIKAVEYTSEALTPPVAAVVPSEPYLQWGLSEVPFATPVTVRLDVLLLIAELGSGKQEAALIDEQVEKAVQAIRRTRGRRITRVTQPGVLRIEKAGDFTGVVIQLEQDTTEPKPEES